MDTRLKNIKYSMGAKAAAVILIWLCFLIAAGSSAFLLYNGAIVSSKSYFDSYDVEFARLVHNAVELNVKLKSEENIKASGEAEKVIGGKLDRFYSIQNRLSNTVNFAYCIKNTQTGEVITNMEAADPIALIKKQPAYVYYNQWNFQSNYYTGMRYENDVKEMLRGTAFEVYAAALEPLKQGDVFYDGFITYSKIKEMSSYVYLLLILSVILLIIAAVYLAYVAGRREKGGEIVLSPVDKIYTDVHAVLVLIAAYLSAEIMFGGFFYDGIERWIGTAIVLSIDAFIGMSYALSMIRQIKCRQLFKNTLFIAIYRGVKKLVKQCLDGKLFKLSLLFLLLAYGVVNGFLSALLILYIDEMGAFIVGALIAVFNIAAVYFAAKGLLSLAQIMEAVKEISTGNVDRALNTAEISVAFSGFAENIKSIQGGLKKAVDEAVKGERMKTDLITNVSHDLKTPLTSIVNYVDLLKREDLDNEKAAEYVCILEEKSARLKQLIEDLVEASKASSGNLAVHAEKVDLHELILQACGEYEEKIKEAELDIRINTDEKNTFINADGKHMWRIIENLMANAIKYSMPHSRVYVNLAKRDAYGTLTIKNISAFPLDIPPEQLTERFVRGDVSRTTEGSGLGLSIAQSLTNLQGGRFKIEIDGDLFKVNIEIPLWTEA